MIKKTTVAAAAATLAAGMVLSKDKDGKPIQVPTDETMRADGMASLSARIRHLNGLGVPTAEIAKIVKRSNGAHPIYQHVRNVLNTPLKQPTAPQA